MKDAYYKHIVGGIDMKLIYPAVFHEDEDGIWVEFPDLQGCQSYGETIEEVLAGAKEALEGYCVTLLEQKKKLPQASDIKKIHPGKNAFVSLVETDLTTHFAKQKSVKKTLTIPSWMNEYAIENKLNCSAILQEGIMKNMNDNI